MKRLLLVLVLMLPLLLGASFDIDDWEMRFENFDHNFDRNFQSDLSFSIFQFITLLVIGAILIALLKNRIASFANHGKRNLLPNLGIGLLLLIAIPVLAVLSFITIIGIPFGIFLIILYVFLIVSSWYLSAFIIGNLIISIDAKSSFGQMFLSLFIGSLLLSLLGMVPIIGWPFETLFLLIAFGTIFRSLWNRIR